MSVEEQLRRIERRHARLKGAFLLATLFTWAIFLVGQTRPSSSSPETCNVVRARRFELVDFEGHVVATMSLSSEFDGTISTFNRDGKELTRLGVSESGGGSVTTFDRNGKTLGRIGHVADGATFELYNREEARVMCLGPYRGAGSICVGDRNGAPMISIAQNDEGEGGVVATNRARKVIAVWPSDGRRNPGNPGIP